MARFRMPVLPADGRQRRFLVLVLVDAVGTGMFLPISVLFFTTFAHLSAVEVGVGLSASGIAGLLAAPPGGYLLDRFDARWVLLPTLVLRAACYLGYGTVHSAAGYVPLVCLVGVAAQVGRPARNVLATQLATDTDLVRLLAVTTSGRNVGFGLGGLLASVALAGHSRVGYLAVLWVNAASYLAAAALVPGIAPARAKRGGPRRRTGAGGVLRDRPYVVLTLLNSLVLLHESVFLVGLPAWLARATPAPPTVLGLLSTLNTVLVVGLQVRASRGAETVPGAARAYARSGVAFLAACLLFAFAGGGAVSAGLMLALGVVALTGCEMWSAAGEWGVSIGLAPEDRRGQYLSLYSMGLGLQKVVGPIVVAVVVVEGGRLGWVVLGAAVLAATAVMGAVAARAAQRSPGSPSPAPSPASAP